jgi:hypothetical protein
MAEEKLTLHGPLFTFWARKRLGRPLSFLAIPVEDARRLLSQLQEGEEGPPFRMTACQEGFSDDLVAFLPGLGPEGQVLLRDTLGRIWREFQEEYEGVLPENLEARYSRFIRIM